MKSCPACGHSMADKEDPKAALEIEVADDDDDDDDGETSAKDEILKELMDELGGALDHKLKSKLPPTA